MPVLVETGNDKINYLRIFLSSFGPQICSTLDI